MGILFAVIAIAVFYVLLIAQSLSAAYLWTEGGEAWRFVNHWTVGALAYVSSTVAGLWVAWCLIGRRAWRQVLRRRAMRSI